MNQRISRFGAVLLFAAAALSGCAARRELIRAENPTIWKIDLGISNAYVIQGARPILVDAGWPATTRKLERAIGSLGIDLHALALIVLTHGHADHAGGAPRLREASGAKVLAHRADVDMLQSGHNRPLKPMDFLARVIRPFVDKPFPPFTPDLVVEGELDLRPYGIDGKVVATPGHTPGSLTVVLATGDAFVGDMLRGGTVRSHTPTRHFYHDDCRAAEGHIDRLVQSGSTRLLVGHGGPIDGRAAQERFRADPCRS